MKFPLIFSQIKIQINSRTILSLLAAESILLSLLHHWLNFWGLPWNKQILIVIVIAPFFSFLISYLLRPIWYDCLKIDRGRLFLFLLPVLVIAFVAAWRLFSIPETPHQLEIVPNMNGSANEIRVLEIKAAYGNLVPLSNFTNLNGWVLRDGLLIANGSSVQPIRYTFYGPINQQVRVTFETSPTSGSAEVVLDGRRLGIGLEGLDGDQKRARLDTQYLWGSLNFLIIPLIVMIDVFTIILILTLIWLVQEINQHRSVNSGAGAAESFLSHLNGLLLLCGIALILHIINFLATPLWVIKDSPSYLQGVVYWLQYHSLNGVSSYRGPGTTFLFTPFIAAFGRNPWGLKILMHLLAFACVPVSYRLGWQLGRRRWFAFFAGLIIALIPDLYFYSGFVLSEVPHFFFGLLFCTCLLSALETMTSGWLITALLVGSFSILVRSESATALALGIAFLLIKVIWDWKDQRSEAAMVDAPQHLRLSALWRLGLALLIAAIPFLAWSVHNQQVYGFFGVSDYGGAVLFDGWIYFGESSHIPITDQNSPAVHKINAVYPPGLSDTSNVPTPWAIYYLLMQHGYTSEQAFTLLGQASMDSIRKDLPLSLKLLVIKIQKGLEPQVMMPATFLFPDEKASFEILNSDYFDKETLFIPTIINLQRSVNGLIGYWYQKFYTVWFWLGLGMCFICFYRKPFFQWMPIAVITLNSIFLPITIGMSLWRYVLSGIFLLQLFVLAGIQSVGEFVPYYLENWNRTKQSLK